MAVDCSAVTQCDDIKKLKVEFEEVKKNMQKLEGVTERQEKDINELKTNHAETRIYVKQILDSIDKLENKIFTYVGQITAAKEKDEEADRKDRQTDTDRWIGLIKWILGGTIIAIVAYLFGSGGIIKP